MIEKAIFFILVLSVAAIIGFVTAWLYFKRKWKFPLGELQGEMLKQKMQITKIENENTKLKEELNTTNKSENIETESVEVSNILNKQDAEKNMLVEEVAKLKLQLDQRPMSDELKLLKNENEVLTSNNQRVLLKMEQLQHELKECRQNSAKSKVLFNDADISEKDDLKIIQGIGPFIEKKLNDIGIYTYRQISNFDQVLIDKVTTAIEFFPGRIQRDNWVGQAKTLYEKKSNNGI